MKGKKDVSGKYRTVGLNSVPEKDTEQSILEAISKAHDSDWKQPAQVFPVGADHVWPTSLLSEMSWVVLWMRERQWVLSTLISLKPFKHYQLVSSPNWWHTGYRWKTARIKELWSAKSKYWLATTGCPMGNQCCDQCLRWWPRWGDRVCSWEVCAQHQTGGAVNILESRAAIQRNLDKL